ncbi:GNAT superfamily N-acetyltransferase [Novosphingobium chloroacetimidivorans]|uniref:GNAT superfamily N-acetyltransferase n=1 Tax=Novosphingobium chloroacetimidivorans TaxID=1428314 RepID=A0A7W7KDC3_9SPHN|nr:hypothetical protein [Novosphingobium chloroacetimidivorans]MBB4860711.1 GNAT superfamily N-acetyltransferase [Novosphingobium chloroacetimidivorans]
MFAKTGFAPDQSWTRSLGQGLILRATEQPDSPVLDRFLEGYDRAFVLPNEREETQGFRACLSINPVARHCFGRTHREMVMVVEDERTGNVVGGANFLATRVNHPPIGHPPTAVALNYLYVEAAERGRGLARLLKDAVGTLANAAVEIPEDACPPAIFIEQNDPLALSDSDYATDSQHSGVDQVDRLEIWARLGARVVDFPYVQPALSAGQSSDEGLTYAVLNFPSAVIDACYFAAHLESFFGISVLKGQDLAIDPVASRQLATLAAMAQRGTPVTLLPMAPAIAALRALPSRPVGESFRHFARTVAGDD